MRAILAALLATTALPLWAETIPAASRITAVTVYPDGARLTREIRFSAPEAGAHELLVTDMPAGSDPGLIQLAPGEGLSLGAFSLRDDRLPPREDPLSPEQMAAKAEVERLENAEAEALLAIEAVQARIEAAEAQVRFLSSFTGALPGDATPDSIRAMAEMIGAETLTARQAALAARAELLSLDRAVIDVQDALTKARDAFDALPGADRDYVALSVSVSAESAGDQMITVTQYVGDASWRPFYDLDLTRSGGDALAINRSVLVTQYTGEDWSDVALTLSSSRPADQAAPSQLWPDLRRIAPEAAPEEVPGIARKSVAADDMMLEAPVAEAAPVVTAIAGLEGETVVYNYPASVTIASGAEDLRLSLDRLDVTPVVAAWATPRLDKTAFVMASFVNGSTEPLLPGEALLFRDGVLVGRTWLDLIAPGVETDIAFGALDTLRLKREMPTRSEGETGVFTSANQLVETAILTVENTGSESWPVRLLDQAPYSEQDDLEVEITATPAPDETDVDGQRGILAWEFDLAPGAKQTITLEHKLRWPTGMVLQ